MTTETVVNTNDGTFTADVLDRSHELPVVVDFWAPWCGPCRVIGPILEELAAEYAGRVQLVKLNTDESPQMATQYGITGIPAVKAFKDGEVASEFVGALPEPRIRAFFESLLPNEADRLVAEAESVRAAGDLGAARMHLETALQHDPEHERATVGLAGILLDEGDFDGADELLAQWEGDPRFGRVLASMHFRRDAAGQDRAALEARVEANPDDAEAHFLLANVLGVADEWEECVEHLLATVRLDRSFREDAGRLRLLDTFLLLGEEHELTEESRRRLTNLLF